MRSQGGSLHQEERGATGAYVDEFEKVVGDADTLAGMLLEIKGEFPALHEKVTYHHYEFEVLEMDSRRILKVKFTILPKDMEGSEEKE